VLYVDDDPESAGCVAHQLELSGNLAVDTATSGSAGVAAVDETVDCVVCGYEREGANGVEFLEMVRERHPTLPFVLVATDGSEAVAADAAAAGVTEYVPGGVDAEGYRGVVDRIERAVASERNERRSERLQRRLRKLVEHSTDLITVLGPDGTIVFQSPSVEPTLGFEPNEMIGTDAFEFVHPDDRMAVVEAFDRGIERPDDLVEVEWRARTADDDWCWLHSIGTNRLGDPDVDGFVVNHRDVSDQRRREGRLESQRERMDRLVAVLAEEFRDPLRTATQILEDGDSVERVPAAYDRMAVGLDEAVELTEAGLLVPTTASIPDAARAAWERLAADGGNRTDGARVNLPEEAAVRADERRLQRLFDRLFRDAIDHHAGHRPAGGRNDETTLAFRVGTTDEGFFVLVAGVGIGSAEGPPAVWDVGGEGLPVVTAIATAHGWSIERSETPSGDTKVEFTGESDSRG
jgi:PAS domain S-box-containing protein